jgi:hypothetical protein
MTKSEGDCKGKNKWALSLFPLENDILGSWKLGLWVMLMVWLVSASQTAAEEQGAKAAAKVPVTASSSAVGKNGSKQILAVPSLLRTISNESEKDKLTRMVQFIKETRPKPFVGSSAAPKPEPLFCKQFMDDLISKHQVKAIEPDFVTGYDEEAAEKEVTEKLNLKHCEDIEHYSIIPPDANPMLYRRGTLGFNYVSELGGAPYRLYLMQLPPGKKTKYPVLYYNSHEGAQHTGFARLDLKKCEIEDEKGARSEISTSFQIGRNVLVKYKRQVFAFTLDYGKDSGSYRLDLFRMSIPITKGFICHWSYYSEEGKGMEKSGKQKKQQ